MAGKQRNLFALAQEAQKVLEVGFNAGHSVGLMLLAHERLQVTAFDLAEHRYTKGCVEVGRRKFTCFYVVGFTLFTWFRHGLELLLLLFSGRNASLLARIQAPRPGFLAVS